MQIYSDNTVVSFIGTKTEKRIADLLSAILNCLKLNSPQSVEQVHGAAEQIDSLPKILFAQSAGLRIAVQNTIDLLHSGDSLAWAAMLEFASRYNAGLCTGMYDKLKAISPWADRELAFAQISQDSLAEPLSAILVSAMQAVRPDFTIEPSQYAFVYKIENTLHEIAKNAIKLVPVKVK
jgi:hypothetical protein